jgi:hypothetical protein
MSVVEVALELGVGESELQAKGLIVGVVLLEFEWINVSNEMTVRVESTDKSIHVGGISDLSSSSDASDSLTFKHADNLIKLVVIAKVRRRLVGLFDSLFHSSEVSIP